LDVAGRITELLPELYVIGTLIGYFKLFCVTMSQPSDGLKSN